MKSRSSSVRTKRPEVFRARPIDDASRLKEEERGNIVLPSVLTLQQRFERPRETTRYRIDGWQPVNARVILAAQFKAGKTTTVGNLVRSLVDGDPWLGDAQVLPVAGRVTILDNEMSESQAEDWLRKQGIRNSDRVALCCRLPAPSARRPWTERAHGPASSWFPSTSC